MGSDSPLSSAILGFLAVCWSRRGLWVVGPSPWESTTHLVTTHLASTLHVFQDKNSGCW